MSFPRIKITDKGRALLVRALLGERIEFTHFAVGSGECGSSDDWPGLTNLIQHEMDVEFTTFERDGEVVNLGGEFANSIVETPFWWREVGIFATLPDVPDCGSVMCFYGNAEDKAEYVPGSDASVSVTHKWETTLMISSDADVSAVVHSITYVTTDQFRNHSENQENPHNVTAEQVGLGHVPNVPTNNQTPTYTFPVKMAELISGETLSSAFGKIALGIKKLITHLENVNNPHKVTAFQVGAADKNHRSTGTSFGMANETYYGHAKLTDDETSKKGASDGYAASPSMVRKLVDSLNYAASESAGGAATSAKKLTTARKVTVNLESETASSFDGSKDFTTGISGVLPIKHGGIGSSNGATGLKNLFAAGRTVLSAHQIVESLPSAAGLEDGTCVLLLIQEMN